MSEGTGPNLDRIRAELQEGIGLAKCRKCGCMQEALQHVQTALPQMQDEGASGLLDLVLAWQQQMKPIQYTCLGCEYCYPAVALNVLQEAHPDAAAPALACAFELKEGSWPVVPGEYVASCDGPGCPVAVSTLASVELAERLAAVRPRELCIVGKTETENIGIDKIIKNTITNPTIRVLLVAGNDGKGHQSGRTLLALSANGVDERMRIIGAPGKHPVLRNVTLEEVQAFRHQVQVVDLIGCEDVETLTGKVKELAHEVMGAADLAEDAPVHVSAAPVVPAEEPDRVEMDKAGYFVILPQPSKGIVVVEHYDYDNRLVRVIEGRTARAVYWTLVKNGWVSQISHAAYLGKELARAELSLSLGFRYVQDGAYGGSDTDTT
jgi:tetrahydromethanopterin S-methyltransferase subunit A